MKINIVPQNFHEIWQFKKTHCEIFTARRNARIASAVLATAISSVRLSVRQTPVFCQNDGT